jgi:hypothetical protein
LGVPPKILKILMNGYQLNLRRGKVKRTIMSGALYMNDSKSLLRKTLLIAFILGVAVLMTGCTIKASRTVGLPGLKPLANANQVKLIENLEDVKQPYQIVGQVMLGKYAFYLFKGESYPRMKEIAAGMGADGLIGLHAANYGGSYVRNGLAVKWLAPGEVRQDLAVPFVVAVLPIIDSKNPSKKSSLEEFLRTMVVVSLFETSGYYVLPTQLSDFKGGIEKAKTLDDTALRAVGGEDAQLLLCLTLESTAHASVIVMSSSAAELKATIIDKRTRKTIFEGRGSQTYTAGWASEAISPSAKWAALAATAEALGKLPMIKEDIGN